jgi:hypothetical protein
MKLKKLQKLVEEFVETHGQDVSDEVVDACDLLIESIEVILDDLDDSLGDEGSFEEILNEGSEEQD